MGYLMSGIKSLLEHQLVAGSVLDKNLNSNIKPKNYFWQVSTQYSKYRVVW